MNRRRQRNLLGIEGLETRKMLAGNIFQQASAAIQQHFRNVRTATAEIVRTEQAVIKDIIDLRNGEIIDLQTARQRYAQDLRRGDRAAVQQDLADINAIARDIAATNTDLAGIGRAGGQAIAAANREYAYDVTQISRSLGNAIRSRSHQLTSPSPTDIAAHESSTLEGIRNSLRSRLDSLLNDARTRKADADSHARSPNPNPNPDPNPGAAWQDGKWDCGASQYTGTPGAVEYGSADIFNTLGTFRRFVFSGNTVTIYRKKYPIEGAPEVEENGPLNGLVQVGSGTVQQTTSEGRPALLLSITDTNEDGNTVTATLTMVRTDGTWQSGWNYSKLEGSTTASDGYQYRLVLYKNRTSGGNVYIDNNGDQQIT